MTFIATRRSLLALALAALAPGSSFAQGWPSKPVRLVAPFPPGGGADTFGRPLAKVLSEQLGQQVLVENRAGAGGTVGAHAVAQGGADGHTFLIGSVHLAIAQSLYPQLGYHLARDLKPVTTISFVPNVVVVNPNKLPVRDMAGFLAHLKAHPGRLNYGSAGNGTTQHVAVEIFKRRTNTFATHIAYRGAGPAMQDLIGGQIDFMFDVLVASMAHIRAGTVKALAVTGEQRSPALPDVPTLAEAGVKGAETRSWWAIFAPAATPQPVIERMHRAIVAALATPELRAAWQRLGADAGGIAPADAAAFVDAEIARWAGVLRENRIGLE